MANRLTILTCPDRTTHLDNTIKSLELAGLNDLDFEKIIYVDGSLDGYKQYPGWQLIRLADHQLFTKDALLKIMVTAAQDKVEQLFYFEDDIVLCKNALHIMHAVEIPNDVAFLAYCDLKDIGSRFGIATAIGHDPAAPPATGGHWGNQALVLPHRSLQLLIDIEPPEWAYPYASDVYISTIMVSGSSPIQKYGVFYPSLVQHVGDISIVSPGALLNRWGRDTMSFVGESYDASNIDISNLEIYDGKLVSHLPREARLKLRFRQRPQRLYQDIKLKEKR